MLARQGLAEQELAAQFVRLKAVFRACAQGAGGGGGRGGGGGGGGAAANSLPLFVWQLGMSKPDLTMVLVTLLLWIPPLLPVAGPRWLGLNLVQNEALFRFVPQRVRISLGVSKAQCSPLSHLRTPSDCLFLFCVLAAVPSIAANMFDHTGVMHDLLLHTVQSCSLICINHSVVS